MFEFFEEWNPIMQAFGAGLFTWGMTAAGAGIVFLSKEIDRKVLDGMQSNNTFSTDNAYRAINCFFCPKNSFIYG